MPPACARITALDLLGQAAMAEIWARRRLLFRLPGGGWAR